MIELALLLSLFQPPPAPAPASTSAAPFPPGFVWGTATSAVQVEGGNAHSDWEAFAARPGATADGERPGPAARHFELYPEDFDRAAAMHTHGYRLSLEWSRLEPARGRWDAEAEAHYRRVLTALRARGLTPMVTLHHFSNPQWVSAQGGWRDARTVADFEAFSARCAAAFGDLVDTWLTFNEPSVYAMEGYLLGRFPPGRVGDGTGALLALHHLTHAHGRAYRALHRLDTRAATPGGPACEVGVAEHLVAFHPHVAWNPVERAVTGVFEHFTNQLFLDAVTSGVVRTGPRAERHDWLAGSLDFLGVNYYTAWRVNVLSPIRRAPRPGAPVTDLGLEVYPDGLYEVLVKQHRRYGLPVYITELGFADGARSATPAHMVAHLARVGRALADGVPVRGVYWWSLLDNFEWQNGYAGGRFGLFSVDFDDPERARAWTPAARTYAEIARRNALPGGPALGPQAWRR